MNTEKHRFKLCRAPFEGQGGQAEIMGCKEGEA